MAQLHLRLVARVALVAAMAALAMLLAAAMLSTAEARTSLRWRAVFTVDAERALIHDAMLEQALTACPTNKHPNRAMVERLFEIEADEGLPAGLLAAAACHESAYRPDPGCGDSGRSCGIVQFQRWAIPKIRAIQLEQRSDYDLGADPRIDWEAAARYWARHVVRQLSKAVRTCRGSLRGYASRVELLWASAAVTAVRTPRCTRRNAQGRCTQRAARCARAGTRAESTHWRRRRLWYAATQRGLQELPQAR